MILNGIEVVVSCNGVRRPECATRRDTGEGRASTFILSREGKEFEVTVSVVNEEPFTGAHNALWVKLFADGRELASTGIRPMQTLRVDRAKDDGNVVRRLIFTASRDVVGAVGPDVRLDEVGTLEVAVYRAFSSQTASPQIHYVTLADARLISSCKLSNESWKQKPHVVGLGKAFPIHLAVSELNRHAERHIKGSTVYGFYRATTCVAQFQFRSRSPERIQLDGFSSSLVPQVTARTMTKAVKSEILDELDNAAPKTAASSPDHAATHSRDSSIKRSVALDMARISDLIAEARLLKNSFKYPLEPDFLPSGVLDLNSTRNESLHEYQATLKAYNITIGRIADDDAMLQQHRRAALRELEQFAEICERWIRTSSNVFLGRLRGTTPVVAKPQDATTINLKGDPEPFRVMLVANQETTRQKRKREVAERSQVPKAERVDVDVKPIIKPDPDTPRVDKGPSMKARLLQARKTVQEAELAVQQKKLEVSLTDLAILEEEETRETKRRKTAMALAIDLTLD